MNDIERSSPNYDLLIWYGIWLAASLGAVTFLDKLDALFASTLAAVVLTLARADLQRFELPDLNNIVLAILGLAWIAASSTNFIDDIPDALARAAVAGISLLAVRTCYRLLRGVEGLGLGDVKLAAAGAIWLSWPQVPIAVLIAAIAGIIAVGVLRVQGRHGTARIAIPFGAFLAPAIWLAWYAERTGFF